MIVPLPIMKMIRIDGRMTTTKTIRPTTMIGGLLLTYTCFFLYTTVISSTSNMRLTGGMMMLDEFRQQTQQEGGRQGRPTTTTTTTTTDKSTLLSLATTKKLLIENTFVNERNPKNLISPSIYVAIPTIPRDKNVDYLLQVIKSLNDARFPLENIHVLYNGNPNKQTHKRYNQAEAIYSHQGIHFLWNDSPLPEPSHRSSYDFSVPLPKKVFTKIFDNNQGLFEKWLPQIQVAQRDNNQRKDWRRKECHDFLVLMRYMLTEVVYKDVDFNNHDEMTAKNNSWIIFNQDDAVWDVTGGYDFPKIYQLLIDLEDESIDNITRYDFYETGLVSAAFKASSLLDIIMDKPTWMYCDFLPVDWMLWFLEDTYPRQFASKRNSNIVKHIGQISSRQGLVKEEGGANNSMTTTGHHHLHHRHHDHGAVNMTIVHRHRQRQRHHDHHNATNNSNNDDDDMNITTTTENQTTK